MLISAMLRTPFFQDLFNLIDRIVEAGRQHADIVGIDGLILRAGCHGTEQIARRHAFFRGRFFGLDGLFQLVDSVVELVQRGFYGGAHGVIPFLRWQIDIYVRKMIPFMTFGRLWSTLLSRFSHIFTHHMLLVEVDHTAMARHCTANHKFKDFRV